MISHAAAFDRLRKFALVGLLAAFILVALSYLLVSAGLAPFPASALAYLFAFAAAYTGQRSWTFGGRHDHRRALPRYLLLQLACAAFSGVVSHVSVSRFGMPPFAMALVTTIMASAASFVFSSLWVFSDRL